MLMSKRRSSGFHETVRCTGTITHRGNKGRSVPLEPRLEARDNEEKRRPDNTHERYG